MEWDLTDLYSGITDPAIESDKNKITVLSEKFIASFKGKIRTANAETLLRALEDLEKIEYLSTHLICFASLLRAKSTQSTEISAFFQKQSEFLTSLSATLLWFDLEWKEVPEEAARKLLGNPKLSAHKHHLSVSRLFSQYTLSEKEEVLLTKKSQTGISAFKRLYDELISREEFKVTIEGTKQTHTVATITPIMTNHPDRKTRLAAAKEYTKVLTKNEKTYSFILNTKLLDKKVSDEIRGYSDMFTSTLLGYELSGDVVSSLQTAVTSRYDICERFYKAKSKLLGYSLNEVDRYSEIYTLETRNIPFSEAKDMIMNSFSHFSTSFGSIANDFFEQKWIDSDAIPGKSPGAFCMYVSPMKHPYVLMNYTGRLQDVETLAHELGHGIHGYLSRKNNIFEFNPSTATAEIASVFCENVVFEKLYSTLTNKQEKINLLGSRIQGVFATVFRQIAFFEFEKRINEHRRVHGELSPHDFGALYQESLQAMFGEGLTLSPDHTKWWMSIKHFFAYNFYVFTYSFGELLTHSLYQKYKVEGDAFVTKYEEMLALGGSLPPAELLLKVGVDITKPDFWLGGLSLIDDLVKEFEALTEEEK